MKLSSCFKELYEYDFVRKCSKCGNISLKSIFYKYRTKEDGY